MLNILLSLLRLFQNPNRVSEVDDWAQLEFGRKAIPSDLEGRVL